MTGHQQRQARHILEYAAGERVPDDLDLVTFQQPMPCGRMGFYIIERTRGLITAGGDYLVRRGECVEVMSAQAMPGGAARFRPHGAPAFTRQAGPGSAHVAADFEVIGRVRLELATQ